MVNYIKVFYKFYLSLSKTEQIGGLIVVFIISISIFSPILVTHDPLQQSMMERNQSFSFKHILGTDKFGRDIYSRLIIGSRYTLFITLTALLFAAIIGQLIGLLAAYTRGRLFDNFVVWFIDVFMTFPTLLLGVIIVAIFGHDLINVAIAISIAFLPRLTRMARGVAMNVVINDYVEAANAIGASTTRIILVHLLPNIINEMAVITTLWMGTAIQVETSLSFLGLGVQPPHPSWGLMIREGIGDLYINPWSSMIPAISILITILGFNMLADGLQEKINPTMKNK